MYGRIIIGVGAGFLALGGCAAPPKAQSSASAGEAEGSGANAQESGGETTTDGGSGPLPSSSSGEGDSSTSQGFIIPLDVPGDFECSPWTQDCPSGEKCTAFVNDGGQAWNATKCVPISANPGQPGDTCSVDGIGSGFDDCDARSMCWDVDPDTSEGSCIAFCTGTEENPVCDQAMTSCIRVNDGALNLCLPNCSPLLMDCDASTQNCYPAPGGFACAPDVSGENGRYGDPCAAINTCDNGLYCEAPELVPGCTAESCCTTFCDLDDPDASAQCPGAAGGQLCVPWFQPGTAPPGLEDLGSCVIPQ